MTRIPMVSAYLMRTQLGIPIILDPSGRLLSAPPVHSFLKPLIYIYKGNRLGLSQNTADAETVVSVVVALGNDTARIEAQVASVL